MSEHQAWFVSHRRSPRARLRLYCFPYAGGGASLFRKWADFLPDAIEVAAVQLPGRESRLHEAPFQRLEPMVEALTGAVRDHADLPFAFFGHSMGALIGFEVARSLRREHLPGPVHLIASGAAAPQIPRREPAIHGLSDGEFLSELHRYGGTPQAVLEHEELMKLLMPLLRADFAVCETYAHTPGAPLACPITAFGGAGDTMVSHEDLAAWAQQTDSTFHTQMFPGGHFFLSSAQSSVHGAIAEALGIR